MSKQIGDVTNIDKLDSLDRQKLEPRVKLELLMSEAREKFGADPRSGGFALVARPRVWLQFLIDMKVGPFTCGEIEMQKPIVIGTPHSDIVGWFQKVPLIVRCTVVDDNVHCIRLQQVPESKVVDRQRAGMLRIASHAGTLEALKSQ